MTLLLGDAMGCRMLGWVKRLCKAAVWSTLFWSSTLLLVWRYWVSPWKTCQDSWCTSRDAYRFYRSNINCLFLKWHQTSWSNIFFLRVSFLKLKIKFCCTIILPVFSWVRSGRKHMGWGCSRAWCWEMNLFLRKRKWLEGTENWKVRNPVIYTPHDLSLRRSNQRGWAGVACTTGGGEEKCIQSFGWEALVTGTAWKA
jgi:hypothetical protein